MPADPSRRDPGDVVSRSKFNFFIAWSCVAYQIIENHECSNMVANSLRADPLPPHTHTQSWDGINRSKNKKKSEHGYVAHQFKGNMFLKAYPFEAKTAPKN